MAIMHALRGAGYDPYFFDIDGLRPSFEEIEMFFRERQPDVLGISAVVATAYGNVKKLTQIVRRVSPRTRILLGGNLAASSEMLHRLAGVDYCAVGEGEIIAVNLMKYLQERVSAGNAGDDFDALSRIPGLTYLDARGDMVFTGFETRIPADQLFEPDYGMLEQYSRIENFICEPTTRYDFSVDPRTFEPHRRGKKMATLISAKGCVARCTFCHRWDKGYRAVPAEAIVRRIKHLMERHNVGFIAFGDENFGSDRRQVKELIELLKPLDILYQVGGVRCRTVDPELLREMKGSGCVSLFYGMESGSQKILDVMEKNSSLEHNRNAALWTHDAGLFTIFQLVLGMPGENEQTIRETIEFFKQVTETLPETPVNRLSVNYIQALNGTPVYEYARHRGLIGRSFADEEKYFDLISDTNAGDDTKFLNFTDSDYLTVQSWRKRIILECVDNWRRKHNQPRPPLGEIFKHLVLKRVAPARYEKLRREAEAAKPTGLNYERGGYFNLQVALGYDIVSGYLYPLRTPIIWTHLLLREFRRLEAPVFLRHVLDAARFHLFGPDHDAFNEYMSLRKVVEAKAPAPATPSEVAMAPLRAGR
jgi:radical SAM superfamily enzyme YgiQ (UPF0313 family)